MKLVEIDVSKLHWTDIRCGIYTIKNIKTNELYIGASTDVKNRLSHHKGKLKRGKGENKNLQKSFNEYGIENFEFFLVLECDKDELYIKEREVEEYFTSIGVNLFNDIHCGDKSRAMSERKLSDETKRKISKNHAHIHGEEHYFCKVSDETVSKIKQDFLDGIKVPELSRKYNIPYNTIRDYVKERSRSYVKPYINKRGDKQ